MDQKEPKSKQSERGRETMFRVAYQHQSKLVQIADYKANMIITVSAMIISAIVAIIGYSAVAGKIEEYSPRLVIPIVGIILSCLISLVFAIQAARPKLILNRSNVNSTKRSSLLFFGVIAGYPQEVYLEKMRDLLASETDVYEHMTIDIHNQGVILKRKYNLLVYAYLVLMYGFIISVFIFLVFLVFGLYS